MGPTGDGECKGDLEVVGGDAGVAEDDIVGGTASDFEGLDGVGGTVYYG